MRKIITFLLFWHVVYSFSQYADSFTDGDFSNNPVWTGNTDKFVVNAAKQLQLQAPAITSTAYLSTPSASINNATWQFSTKANLLLTSGNYVCYYLTSDKADLSASLNGYYVMVGNTNKEVALYRQSGTTKTKLVAGVAQRLPTTGSVTEITVKVTRDATGSWTVYSKLPSETAFVTEGSASDATFYKSSFSGIFCNYSSTNSAKYFFDDFSVTGDPFVDNTPPSIVSYALSGNKDLVINFSEPVTLANAILTVPQSLGSYTQSLLGNTLTLSFANTIPQFKTYLVTLEGISDLNGNALPKSDLSFGLFPTGFGDLIFNEIMCDPTPKVGLPEAEYIELYNRRDFSINLSGWKLYYGSKPYTISDGKIAPSGYLLLCPPNAVQTFAGYGATATLNSFPALSSSGQLLYLTNEVDSLIAFVNYSDSWYKNDFKKEGGWSLECADAGNLSNSDNNWLASSDLSGGTPGRKNSTAATVDDAVAPHIIALSFTQPDTLLVQFNKPMLQSDLANLSKYAIDGGLSVKSVKTDYPQGKWARLVLSPVPQHGQTYHLAIAGLNDVNHHSLTETAPFGVADSCAYNDMVINEILSHPQPNGTSFVELYNRSSKIIDLKNLWLNRIKTDGTPDTGFPISILGQQIMPGEYVVLTTNKNGVCNFYTCKEEGAWIEMSNFVSLPNASGNVMLVNRQGIVIDSVSYNEKYHDVSINNPAGVSFERVSPEWASSNPDNWHSCSSDAGYATPGYKNSQFRAADETGSSSSCFWMDNASFTPDNDGAEDLLLIRYKMPENGYSATVTIYDAAGRQVKRIAHNAVLGSEGTWVWNGMTDNTKRANVGVYVIYIDAVLPTKGKREKAKLACVVAVK